MIFKKKIIVRKDRLPFTGGQNWKEFQDVIQMYTHDPKTKYKDDLILYLFLFYNIVSIGFRNFLIFNYFKGL